MHAADTGAPGASAIHYDRDSEGIVTLTMDDPSGSVNLMNEAFRGSLQQVVDRLYDERQQVTGVILASAKKTFFAGGDLARLSTAHPEHASEETAYVNDMKRNMRRLETLGRPVVAAINGTALGGGLEIALLAHHRIAADSQRTRIGLPEVSLGLLPGGGGISRVVRMIGLQQALSRVILPATKFTVQGAVEIGLIDEIVPSVDDLAGAARAWIRDHPDAVKPWDQQGFRLPGGAPSSTDIAATLPALAATLRKQLRGAPMPAPRAALAAAVEGAYVDFDTASLIETRYFVNLTHGQIAKNMIKAMFFDLAAINRGASRPQGHPVSLPSKVGVIGAGMMGAAIAYVTAQAGIDVVLSDMSREAAEAGKNYARELEAKARARGKTTAEKSEALLARIHTSGDVADLAGVDFVIEAVFESVPVKQGVFQKIEGIVNPDAVLGSNTSTLPITLLAGAVERQCDFIGVHFFSPADKMPLVEIVRGEQTSDAALAKVFDYVLAIRKTPIVVNDSRGFFTSRVIAKFMAEAVAAVAEGVEAASVEQAALQAGFPAGALQLADELTLSLSQQIRLETRAAFEAAGGVWVAHPSERVIDDLVALGRIGRREHRGFYDYDELGKRIGIWPGLRERYGAGSLELPLVDLQERMLFAEALEAIACLDEGVLTSVADANIGSIFGIGFPAWTGGVLQYVNQYEGGLQGFVDRARELAAAYGARFAPPDSLVRRAEAGRLFM